MKNTMDNLWGLEENVVWYYEATCVSKKIIRFCYLS